MPFIPKSASDILRQLRGAVLGRSKLNDITPSSALNIMLAAFSEELASSERRLLSIRESFFLNGAQGSDLDRRVAELPPIGIQRIGRTNASGAVMRFERAVEDAAAALSIPAGTVVKAQGGQRYSTTAEVIMAAGDTDVDNVHVICQSAGESGNQVIGAIDFIENGPDQLISCSNTQPLTNGQDRETDTALRERAYSYLRSLSRCQKNAIEFMAISFIGSNGDRFPYARVYEDPEQLGFCELVVDDGSGLNVEAMSRAGNTISTTIAAGGSRAVYHEAPATAPIPPESIIVWKGGDPNTQIRVTPINYTSLHERGVIYFAAGVLDPSDRVFVQNYRVFTGLIAELQREIEGNPDSPDRLTGFRAAGTRMVVNVVTPQFIKLDMALSPESSVNYRVVEANAVATITGYVGTLSPGETLIISRLVDLVMEISGVRDVKFFERDSAVRAENIDTIDSRHALRVNADSIKVTTSNQE